MAAARPGRMRPAPGEEPLSRVLGRLSRIPDRFRVFGESAADAQRRHGVDADLLDALTDLGLPFAPTVNGPRYDALDLANTSLALALPSPRLMAMRGWSAAIRTAASKAPTTYVVAVEPNCPHQDHDGPCTVETAPQLCEQSTFSRSPDGAITLTRHVRGRTAHEYPEVSGLTDLVRPIHFHLLPDGLSADVGFLRETGLADCSLAARYLVQEAAALGLTARRSFGLFVAAPYSIPHSWLDLYLGGAWVPFDPHLLNVLTGWGLLSADEWPSHRSIGDAAWHLAEDEFQIARHTGKAASVSFPTRSAGK